MVGWSVRKWLVVGGLVGWWVGGSVVGDFNKTQILYVYKLNIFNTAIFMHKIQG